MKYQISRLNIYTIESCNNNPNALFVFGDNILRSGRGGQAIIRECANAIGIATKVSPAVYMNDEQYLINQISIDADIMNIRKAMANNDYSTLVFPTAGLGWGRAQMQSKCPKTALYLSQRLLEEFGYNNIEDLVNSKQF